MRSWIALLSLTHCGSVHGWSHTTAIAPCNHRLSSTFRRRQTYLQASIQLQRDYGRGEDHLSAFLQEGDVVVYQTGTWYVDGVEVGDGRPPMHEWAKIDSLQVVWTHNCEHGVLRGIALEEETATTNSNGNGVLCLCETDPMEFIEFGPEQLLARVMVEWDDEAEARGTTSVPHTDADSPSFWIAETE